MTGWIFHPQRHMHMARMIIEAGQMKHPDIGMRLNIRHSRIAYDL
jgi:hypothetical protein